MRVRLMTADGNDFPVSESCDSMKKDQRMLFWMPTVVLGLIGMVLRVAMLRTGFDEKGLLIRGHYSVWGLWAVSIGFAVLLICLLRRLEGSGKFRDIFPKCALSGGLAMAGGVGMGIVTVLEFSGIGDLVLGLLASAGMVFTGLCRVKGRRPNFLFHAIVCVYVITVLLRMYQFWSADSQLQDYACQMMALVLLMLFSFHRSCCDAGIIDRKKLVFTGLAACFLCLVSLSDGQNWGFYLAAGLWTVGSMCNLNALPEKKEENEDQ